MAEDVQGIPATPGGSGGASALSPGQRVGLDRYTLQRQLGQGGMGMVWLAQDEQLGEEVALKFLAREISHDADSLDELRRETLKSRKLTHPNIIRIHDLHHPPGEAPFISMEYVEGQSLSKLKAEQPRRCFGWEQVKPWVRQLCDALDYAHGEHVIHRDLKPANLMLDAKGRLKLADFGLAAVVSDSLSRVSLQQHSSGTPAYMSPQQMEGRTPKVADDIYALGATLYELLTSKPPFYQGNILHQVKHVAPDALEQRLAEFQLVHVIPPEVGAMILACLAKDPGQRPQSARAVAEWIGLKVGPEPGGRLMGSGSAAGMAAVRLEVQEQKTRPLPELAQEEPPGQTLPPAAAAEEAPVLEQEPEEEVEEVRAGSLVRSQTGLWVGSVLAMLVVVGLGGWWLASRKGEAKGKESSQASGVAKLSQTDKTGASAVGGGTVASTGTAMGNAPTNMVLVPAGPFQMGDTFGEGSTNELPVHTVQVSAYYMDKGHVTKALWGEVFQWATNHGYSYDNAGTGKGSNYPIQRINWFDALKWCNARSEKEGRVPAYYTSGARTTVFRSGQVDVANDWVNWNAGYRLPTEAEWEKAARGGLKGKRFPWGDTISHNQANYWSTNRFTYDVSSTRGYHPTYVGYYPGPSPVGAFAANGYGLYDMAGNVYQLCWDDLEASYYASSPAVDPRGPLSGKLTILRGGSFFRDADMARTAFRYYTRRSYTTENVGFRTVLPAGQP